MIENSIPVIKKDIFTLKKKLNDELLLRTRYALDQSNFRLNTAAIKYFELFDGKNTCEDIIHIMKDNYPAVPIEIFQRDLKQTLHELHKRGIIQWENNINAFGDDMEDKINASTVYLACDYNEAQNLISYSDVLPVNYVSPYFGFNALKDYMLIETYLIYNSMFIFQIKKDNEIVCEVLCECSHIDFSIQIAYLSYDNERITDKELINFFTWISNKIFSKVKPDAADEKKYLFMYVNELQEKYSFLSLFVFHGILEKEIKNQADVSCYTFCN